MREDETLRRLVGLADGCELVAAALAFPSPELAAALADGSFAQDAEGCAHDFAPEGDGASEASADQEPARAVSEPFAAFRGADPGKLRAALRTGYSLAHDHQADGVAVFSYEAAFRHRHAGKPGSPALFRAPVTLDVEHHMRQAGVLPKDSRTEPCDSLWDEFSFLSYVYGMAAETYGQGDDDGAALWRGRAASFLDGHLLTWADDYFDDTAAELERLVRAGEAESVCAAFYGELFAYARRLVNAMGRESE